MSLSTPLPKNAASKIFLNYPSIPTRPFKKKDFMMLVKVMSVVRAKWEGIGLVLAIPDETMTVLSDRWKNTSAQRGLISVLFEWMKGSNVDKRLNPCWYSVVYVVADYSGGKSPAAAMTIAQKWKKYENSPFIFCEVSIDRDHLSVSLGNLNPDDLSKELYRKLREVKHLWYEIGVLVGLPEQELLTIDKKDDKLVEVIKKWLLLYFDPDFDDFPEPTLAILVDAVAHTMGGANKVLATSLAEYVPQTLLDQHPPNGDSTVPTSHENSALPSSSSMPPSLITLPQTEEVAAVPDSELKGRVEQDGSPSRHLPSITVPSATRSPAVPVGATAITVPPATSPAVPVGATATKFETDRRQLLNIDQNTAYSATELLGLTPAQLDGSNIKLAIIDLGFFIPHPCLSPDAKVITDDKQPNPQQDPYHGIQVAAIAAGKSIAGHKVVNGVPTGFMYPGGIAPKVKLTLCQFNDTLDGLRIIFEKLKHDDNFNHVVFISWGIPQEKFPSKRLTEFSLLVHELAMKGTIILAASGNSGNVEENRFPSCLPNVISVGCHTNLAKTPAYSSDIGVDISCFGEVLAPYGPLQLTHDSSGIQLPIPIPNLFIPVVGTSMATPVAAAVVCLGLQCAERFGSDYLKLISSKDCILKMLKAMKNSKGALKPSKFLSEANEKQFANLLIQN